MAGGTWEFAGQFIGGNENHVFYVKNDVFWNHRSGVMKKYCLILGLFVVAGCVDEVVRKSESVRWESAGTLVSISPDKELTRYPDELRSAFLGEAKFIRTRVETTEGVYVVGDKIGVVESGVAVNVGYTTTSDMPVYLDIGGVRYKIVP